MIRSTWVVCSVNTLLGKNDKKHLGSLFCQYSTIGKDDKWHFGSLFCQYSTIGKDDKWHLVVCSVNTLLGKNVKLH